MRTKFKKIGLIGAPYSGQTALLCGLIGEMKRYYSASYNVLIDKYEGMLENEEKILPVIERYATNGYYFGWDSESPSFPYKTCIVEAKHLFPISCNVKKDDISFHLFFNNIAGELFTEATRHLKKLINEVDTLIFTIPPKNDDYWFDPEEVFCALQNALNDVIIDVNREKISVIFVLTKNDTGYLNDINSFHQESLRHYLIETYGLERIIIEAEMTFKNVSYFTTGLLNKDDIGLISLCDELLKVPEKKKWWKNII